MPCSKARLFVCAGVQGENSMCALAHPPDNFD
jgi:hypothetical protein